MVFVVHCYSQQKVLLFCFDWYVITVNMKNTQHDSENRRGSVKIKEIIASYMSAICIQPLSNGIDHMVYRHGHDA